jgi:hypothetical protein
MSKCSCCSSNNKKLAITATGTKYPRHEDVSHRHKQQPSKSTALQLLSTAYLSISNAQFAQSKLRTPELHSIPTYVTWHTGQQNTQCLLHTHLTNQVLEHFSSSAHTEERCSQAFLQSFTCTRRHPAHLAVLWHPSTHAWHTPRNVLASLPANISAPLAFGGASDRQLSTHSQERARKPSCKHLCTLGSSGLL